LIKESRFYKENASKLDNKYPLSRAQKFLKDIKKLGLHEGKETYLGLFRNLVIEIGNALGYVRMVRAGGLRYISEAIKYVPNLDHIEDFDELVKEDNLSDESFNAAKNLKDSVLNMKKKFAEGSDYFQLLDKVLTTELNKEENTHLKNFYLIIPPLTISYIENMIIAKDKMVRSGKEANFTEDGFALGVAFILKILGQNSSFDSLHWFESVEQLYNEEFNKLQESMKKKNQKIEQKIQEKDDHDNYMKLTLNKVKTYLRENELLLFSFSASRIFFKD
jgi:WASH complex subunit 7